MFFFIFDLENILKFRIHLQEDNIVIATAHPCKFEDAVQKAIGIKIQIPKSNASVMEKEEILASSSKESTKEMILDFFG